MTENFIDLTTAARRSPGRPSTCAVWRWARKGVKSRTGERIQLQHIRAGGKLFTTDAWLHDFFEAVANADRAHFNGEPIAIPKPRTEKRRERQIESAESQLRAAGIL